MEGLRRHLEDSNPTIETLGVPGFFGVAVKYQPSDGRDLMTLAPVCLLHALFSYLISLS